MTGTYGRITLEDRVSIEEGNKMVMEKFQSDNGFESNTNFYLWNQGTMIMLLFGLLVVPREFWARFLSDDGNGSQKSLADKLIFDKFVFVPNELFKNEDDCQSVEKSKDIFLRKLRNSVSHNRIEILKGENGVFKFTNKKDAGVLDFSVSIKKNSLAVFLSKIGKFFIEEVNK